MIESMTGKLKSGHDLTPKEAEKLYVEIKRRMKKDNIDPALFDWFNAVTDALRERRRGNFITAMPFYHEGSDYSEYFVKIRSYLYPTERISLAYLFNFDVKLNEEAGVEIDRGTDFTVVNCHRLGWIDLKISRMELFKAGTGKMNDYIDDLREFCLSTDNTPLSSIKNSDGLADMKAEFLKKSCIPVLLACEDYLYDDPAEILSEDVCNFVVLAKDCDLVRRISGLKPEDVIEMVKKSWVYKNPVKSDVPDILEYYLGEQIEYER